MKSLFFVTIILVMVSQMANAQNPNLTPAWWEKSEAQKAQKPSPTLTTLPVKEWGVWRGNRGFPASLAMLIPENTYGTPIDHSDFAFTNMLPGKGETFIQCYVKETDNKGNAEPVSILVELSGIQVRADGTPIIGRLAPFTAADGTTQYVYQIPIRRSMRFTGGSEMLQPNPDGTRRWGLENWESGPYHLNVGGSIF
jgi:hypothetical protein